MPSENTTYATRRLTDESYSAKLPLDKALFLGDSTGCPVAKTLTQEPSQGGRGALAMIARYGEVIYWSGEAVAIMNRVHRSDLVYALTQPIKRLADEPLGIHDEGWTPKILEDYILVSPQLYALPRLATILVNSNKQSRAQNVFLAQDTLEKCAFKSHTLNQLLVSFADSLVSFGFDKNLVLKNLLSKGKLGEDNCYSIFREILKEIRRRSPFLWQTYQDLTCQERTALGIANLAL